MTNTAAPAARPASSVLDDDQLLQFLTRQRDAARADLRKFAAKVGCDASPAYMARWNMGDAVEAEITANLLDTAITAAKKGQMRQALAYGIAASMNVSTRASDPFDRAAAEVERDAAAKLLRRYGTEIDMETFLGRL